MHPTCKVARSEATGSYKLPPLQALRNVTQDKELKGQSRQEQEYKTHQAVLYQVQLHNQQEHFDIQTMKTLI